MASKADPGVLKKTISELGKVIKKPALTEKLLGRPPFRYLHDIIMEVQRTSGFFEGLYSGQETDGKSIQEKEAKCQFLQKAISVLSLATGEVVKVRPSRIVAGQEVERTNEFLQLLAKAVLSKVDSREAVKKVLSGSGEEPAQKPPPATKSKEKEDREKRKKEKSRGSVGSEELAKQQASIKERPGESRKRSSGNEASKKKSKEPKDTGSEEQKKESSSSLHSKSRSKVSEESITRPTHRPSRKRESAVESGDQDRKRESAVESGNQDEHHTTSGTSARGVASGGSDGGEDEGLGGSETKIDRPPSAKGGRRVGHGKRGSLPSQPSDEPGQQGPPQSGAAEPVQTKVVAGDTRSVTPPPQTLPLQGLPPQGLTLPPKRRGSARPAPPRIVQTSKKEDPNATASGSPGESPVPPVVIMDTPREEQQDSDDDEQFVVEDSAPVIPPPEEAFVKSSEEALMDEKPEGALTKNIVAMKERLEGDLIKKEGSDHEQTLMPGLSEAHRKKEREMVSKEIEKLQASIQTLCQSANPLGKIMDYVQEDIDSMQKELEMWQTENKRHADSLQKEQSITELELQPLRAQLEDLEAKIVEQVDMISSTKANILKNDLKCKQMLNSMTFAAT